jgi:hypothetical protein
MNNDYRTRYYKEKRRNLLLSRNESEGTTLFDLEETKEKNQKQSILCKMMKNIFKK